VQKNFENGGVLLNSGGGAATLGWPATAPERCCSPEKMSLHLLPFLFPELFVREK